MATKGIMMDYKNFIKKPKWLNPLEAPNPRRTKKRKNTKRRSVYGDGTGFPTVFPQTRLSHKSKAKNGDQDVKKITVPKASPQSSKSSDNEIQSDVSDEEQSLPASPIANENEEEPSKLLVEETQTENQSGHDGTEMSAQTGDKEEPLDNESVYTERDLSANCEENVNCKEGRRVSFKDGYDLNATDEEINEEGFVKEYEYRPYNQRRGKDFEEMDEDEKINYFMYQYHMHPEQIRELTFQPKVNETQLIHQTYTGVNANDWRECPDHAKAESERKLKSRLRKHERKVSVTPSYQRKDFMLSQLQGKVYYNMKGIYENSPRDYHAKRFYERLSQVQEDEIKRQNEITKGKERKRRESMIRQRNQLKFVRDKHEFDAWKRFMTQYVTRRVTTEPQHISRKQYGLPDTLDIGFEERNSPSKTPTKPSKEKTNKKKFETLFNATPRPVWKADDNLKFEGFDSVYLEKEDESGEIEKQRLIVKDLIKEAGCMVLYDPSGADKDSKKNKNKTEKAEHCSKRSPVQSQNTKSISRDSLPESGIALSDRTVQIRSRNRKKPKPLLKRHSCPSIQSEDKTKNWVRHMHSSKFLQNENSPQNSKEDERNGSKQEKTATAREYVRNRQVLSNSVNTGIFKNNHATNLMSPAIHITQQQQENGLLPVSVSDSQFNGAVRKRSSVHESEVKRSGDVSNLTKKVGKSRSNEKINNAYHLKGNQNTSSATPDSNEMKFSYDSFVNTKLMKQSGNKVTSLKEAPKSIIKDSQSKKQNAIKVKQNMTADTVDMQPKLDIPRTKHESQNDSLGQSEIKASLSDKIEVSKRVKLAETTSTQQKEIKPNYTRKSTTENGVSLSRKSNDKAGKAQTPNKASLTIKTRETVEDTQERSLSSAETERKVQWKDLVNKYLKQPPPVIGKTADRVALETNYDSSDDDSEGDIFERAMRRHNLNLDDDDDEDSD